MDDKSKKSSTRSSTTTASQGSSSIINKANTNVLSKNVAAATSSSTTATKNSTSSIQHMTTNENEYDDDFYLNNDDDEDIIDDYDDDDDYVDGDDDEDFNMEEDEDDDDDQSKIQKASIDSNHNKNVSAITVTTNRSVSNAINLPPVNKTTASHVSTSLSASLMAPKSNHKDVDGVGCTSSSLSSQRAAAGYLNNRKRNVELDDEFKYEVLTPDKIVNHMIDCIKEVNQVLELPPTTTRILLHHFRWDKEKLMERFYDGDQDRLFKEAHIVSPFKSVNSGGPSTCTVTATTSSSSSKKVGC